MVPEINRKKSSPNKTKVRTIFGMKVINNKPKVNKDNLSQLFKPVIDKTKDNPSDIDVANIHANLKEENEEELAQFYHKEVTPAVFKTNFQPIEKPNPLLAKVNHILELLEQQKEIKTNQKK